MIRRFFTGERVTMSTAGLLIYSAGHELSNRRIYRLTILGPSEEKADHWRVRIEPVHRNPLRLYTGSPIAEVAQQARRYFDSRINPAFIGHTEFPDHMLSRSEDHLPGYGDTNDPLPGGWPECAWKPSTYRSTP